MLAAGETARAVPLYTGRLLPGSKAPGIIDIREKLDRRVREAALMAESVDVLWRWSETITGHSDSVALATLARRLPQDDPRRVIVCGLAVERKQWL